MEYFDVKNLLSDEIRKKMTKRVVLTQKDREVINFYEEICAELENKIPKEIGEMLVKENNNPDYTLLIHRTSRAKKEEFFKNGLRLGSGNDLEYTTSRYENNLTLFINIASAHAYKSNSLDNGRCILIKIPNTALNYEKGKTKPILIKTDDMAEQSGGMIILNNDTRQTFLLPEYILGSLEFNNDKEISEFISNPNYREIHDYKNDGLACPSEVIYEYIKQNPEVGYDKKDMVNDIICRENTEYENNREHFEEQVLNREGIKKIAKETVEDKEKMGVLSKIQSKMKDAIRNLKDKDKEER